MQRIDGNRQSMRHVRLAAVILVVAAGPVVAQPMGERVTSRNILVDTHVNPSAGRLVVMTRERKPVTELPGWLLAVAADDIVIYHRNSVHFAPTRSVEVWTWNPSTLRDQRLYPNAPWDSARRAYVDTVRAIYRRLGPNWFRINNHHMDPERFDSRLQDSVVVDDAGRTVAFRLVFGGGEGTPAATPRVDVLVRCENIGVTRPRCAEQRLPARRDR